jgi:hypothetical protein
LSGKAFRQLEKFDGKIPPVSRVRLGPQKLQKIGGKIKNVGAPTFLEGVYSLVFA